MPSEKIGFIGIGNMGESILRGALERGAFAAESVWVTDVVLSATERAKERYGVRVAKDLTDLVSSVDWLIYCAKPQNIPEILPALGRHWRDGQWLLSIAAGITTPAMEACLPAGVGVIRVMPNIAASVGEAATGICGGSHAREEHFAAAERLFGAVGKTVRVAETYMDTVTGLSGSGPAFVFLVIEALTDAGVQNGLTFDQARILTTQTVLGAAKMAQETGEHPAVLKARVTSPGGTTAAGLFAMEKGGVRAALAEAVSAATLRSKELGKK